MKQRVNIKLQFTEDEPISAEIEISRKNGYTKLTDENAVSVVQDIIAYLLENPIESDKYDEEGNLIKSKVEPPFLMIDKNHRYE